MSQLIIQALASFATLAVIVSAMALAGPQASTAIGGTVWETCGKCSKVTATPCITAGCGNVNQCDDTGGHDNCEEQRTAAGGSKVTACKNATVGCNGSGEPANERCVN